MNGALALAGATLPLAAAPLVYVVTTRRPVLARALDGFILASIGLLVVMHLLPDAVEHAGIGAVIAAVLGLATPIVLERVSHVSARRTHGFALGATLIGLAVHAAIDGVALATASGTQGGVDPSHLVFAVILHRLPVGLAIWWLARPRWGAGRAWAVLALVAVATALGFVATQPLWEAARGSALNLGQAYVAGMLLHVLFHGRGVEASPHAHDGPRAPGGHHEHHEHDEDHGHDQDHDHTGSGAWHHPGADDPCCRYDDDDDGPESCCGHGGCADGAAGADPGGTITAGCADGCHAPRNRWAWAETLGALCGVALVTLLDVPPGIHDHGAAGHGFWDRFLELSLDSAPALLLGFVLAGVVSVFLPKASMRWLRGGGALGQTFKGMAFGLPLPICSCGVVPMYQSLIRRGVPPAAAMAFLVATPEIGIEAIALSVPFLGVKLTLARLAAAAAVAVAVGWLVGRTIAGVDAPYATTGPTEPPAGWKLREALRFSFVEIVDETAAWLLVGLAIAAAIEPASMSAWLAEIPGWAEVLGFAALGLPIYVCASGATPLAAAMILAGASPGAAIAFLLAGPATNVTTFGVLSRLHGPGRAIAFGVAVFGTSVVCGIAVDALFGAATIPALAPDAHADGSPLAWFSLAALAVAFGAAVLRQGPRAFLSTVVSFGEDEHDHA